MVLTRAAVWWLLKSEKDVRYVNEKHKTWIRRDSVPRIFDSQEAKRGGSQTTVRENNKIVGKKITGGYDLKQHKPRFEQEFSKSVNRRMQATLQQLQDVAGMAAKRNTYIISWETLKEQNIWEVQAQIDNIKMYPEEIGGESMD